jgi:peptide/nickel transport system substrate-binding protein
MNPLARVVVPSAAVVIALGLLTAPVSASTPTASKPKMQQGGSLTLLNRNDAPCVGDPTRVLPGGGSASPYFNAAFGGLVVIDVVTNELRPDAGIASSLTSKDGITWVMKLRPNVQFTDGTSLDAAAVVANWDRDRTATSIYANGIPKSMQAVKVLDPLTLQIQLLAVNRQFPAYLAYSNANWIVSPKWLQTPGADICGKAVGAGPFMVDSRTAGVVTVYKRNPNYWNKPLPYLDTLTMKINPDFQSSLDTIATGGADAAYMSNTAIATSQRAKDAKIAFTNNLNSGGRALAFNASKAPFNDVRARQAVSWAIDPVKITEALFPGDVGATTLFGKNSPYHNPKIKLASNNPKKAQALFDELAAAGKPLSFTIAAPPAPELGQSAQAIQTQLAAYKNVTVKIATLDTAGFNNALANRNYEAAMAGTSSVNPEPLLAGAYSTGGPFNSTGFSDPTLDQAFAEARNAANLAQAKAAYDKVAKIWAKVVPNVFYNQQRIGYVHTSTTAGFDFQSGFGTIVLDRIGFVKNK